MAIYIVVTIGIVATFDVAVVVTALTIVVAITVVATFDATVIVVTTGYAG